MLARFGSLAAGPQQDRLESTLATTTATPEQVAAAVEINAAARLRALKLSFLTMAVLALLVIVPSRRLPGYVLGKVPSLPAASD